MSRKIEEMDKEELLQHSERLVKALDWISIISIFVIATLIVTAIITENTDFLGIAFFILLWTLVSGSILSNEKRKAFSQFIKIQKNK